MFQYKKKTTEKQQNLNFACVSHIYLQNTIICYIYLFLELFIHSKLGRCFLLSND